MKTFSLHLFSFLGLSICSLQAVPLKIVAAENFYGGIAQQIAGPDAKVTSILSNPNQDPHEFTTNASTARAVADADIVIYNGAGYDDWMQRLLKERGKKEQVIIEFGHLSRRENGENPHFWYEYQTIDLLAEMLRETLTRLDPAHRDDYQKRSDAFFAGMALLMKKIETIREKAQGTKVTATEPVFGYMAKALGFQMLNEPFQWKVMNDTEPSPKETAAFEKSLITHEAKILFYNNQVADPASDRLKAIAEKAGIPVIGVTETQPPQYKTYVEWMTAELDQVEAALQTIKK